MADMVKGFPSSKQEALAYLYTQSQDLSGKSPEEVLEIYDSAYEKIVDKSRELKGIPPHFNRETQ